MSPVGLEVQAHTHEHTSASCGFSDTKSGTYCLDQHPSVGGLHRPRVVPLAHRLLLSPQKWLRASF